MTDLSSQTVFTWVNRAFWLIWLGFPVLIWQLISEVLDGPERLRDLAPDQAACLGDLPQPATFSTAGAFAFWSAFAIEIAIYAVLLAMAHSVIRRCAQGRVFVAPMIATLLRIGVLIAVFPLIDLILTNASMWFYTTTGDLPVFIPSFALDIPVLGVGLLLITMAAALRMAMDLHDDAQLTI